MKRIRAIAMILSACVLASMGAGCTNNGSGTGSGAASAGDKITLTYSDSWVDPSTEPTAAAVKLALADWAKENPDITIEADHTTSANSSYKTKIKTALAAGTQSDVFNMSFGSFTQPYVDAGKLMALDGYISTDTLKDMKKGVIDIGKYGGKIYGLPFNMNANFIACNTELFTKYNVEYPKTYTDLLEACKAFKAKGVTPIAMGDKELWQAQQFFEPIVLRENGPQYSVDACNKKQSFDNDGIRKSAQVVLDFAKAGAFSNGMLGLTFVEGAAQFANGQAAMSVTGTWGISSFEGDGVAVNGKVKLINFPELTGGNGSTTATQAGPYEHFSMSASTKHPKEAAKFLLFMSREVSKYSFTSGAGLPVWNLDSGVKTDSKLLQQAVDLTQNVTSYTSGWDFYLSSAAALKYQNLLSELITNRISAEDFSKQLQQANAG